MSWEAYQLDIATWTVGRWVDSKLAEHDKKGKPLHRVSELLDDVMGPKPASEYRAWPGVVTKMKIPESGVW